MSLVIRRFGLLNERDIKKLIAYSTINHVSLMIYLLRFKLFKVVYFHLNIHAIFKSLIFICFGFLILSSFHAQDKRLVTLLNLNPLIKLVYYFSCLCLAGLPFLRGFFSKDLIIEKFISVTLELSFVVILLIFLGVRIYYRIKLIRLVGILYSYTIIEKSNIGIFRVLIMRGIIISLVNVYLSLVFRLTLEFFSFKIIIYLIIIVFLVISLSIKINYKLVVYEKFQNWKEVWFLDVNSLEKYVY